MVTPFFDLSCIEGNKPLRYVKSKKQIYMHWINYNNIS
jgi:hypothetical protein